MDHTPSLYLFDNFDLRFEAGVSPNSYRARVESSAGQATGAYFTLPSEWTTSTPHDEAELEAKGRALFDLIFQGDVAVAFARSKETAENKGKSLRLRLRLQDTPALTTLPWETLTPPNRNPLSLSRHTPIVHYLDLLDTPKPLPITLPLRLLVVIAAPPSHPLIDGEKEWEALTVALRPLQHEGLVVLERLPNATYAKLQAILSRPTPYHVLHYVGHSRFNAKSNQGELLLESEEPNQDEAPLAAKDFAQLLADHRSNHSSDPRSLRLAYLNSCQGAVGQTEIVAGGIAHALVQQSLPAVIAMQGYIPDDAAVAIAAHFYRALAQGNPVDVALAMARQSFRQESPSAQPTWALPALFLRSDNSYLFALPGQQLPDAGIAQLPPAPGDPPYQGLAYYDLHDHARFFGREILTEQLVAYLRENQSLMVVGASGSGKSSLVRAGLLPALLGLSNNINRALLPRDPATWQLHLFTPTAQPLSALAATLTKDEPSVLAAKQLQSDMEADPAALDLYLRRRTSGSPTARILLLIDQSEELFTLCKEAHLQQRFIEILFYALEHEAPVTLILTLRADFYHKCNPFPALRTALEQHQRYIGAMSPEELRRAIELPARQGKWTFETGLVELLLEDAGTEPGNLPLLSHALHETWKNRSGRTLTFAGYVASGRIQGAIARTADSTFAGLSASDQALARKLFVELTELGEGTQDTRRRIQTTSLNALATAPDQLETLLKRLADARLLSTDTETTEVAHEALIREWATLRHWVDEDRTWVRFQRELARDVQQWETLQRDSGSLYGGARLARAMAETQRREADLRPIEREFLAESQRQETEAEIAKQIAEERYKRNRLLTRFAWALGALLFLALGLAGVAYRQSMIANDERQVALTAQANSNNAEATAQVAQQAAEAERRQTLSLRLAAESANLFANKQRSLALLTAVEAVKRPIDNNETIASGAAQQLHKILGNRIGLPFFGHTASITTLAFSPDGNWLATGSDDTTTNLWNLSDPTADPITLQGHSASITTLAFSPDGNWLATGGFDSTAHLWNLSDPTADPITLQGHTNVISTLAFSPDGNWLATGSADTTANLWNLSDPTTNPITLKGHSASITTLAFSPDGNRFATGSDDSTVNLWNLSDPTADPITLEGHSDSIYILAFSPDGNRLATGGLDDTANLWNLSNPTAAPLALEGHTNSIYDLAFSPDGNWLATGGLDNTGKLWNLSDPTTDPITLEGHANAIYDLAFSPDGTWLATGSGDTTVNLWNLTHSTTNPITLQGHTGAINTLAFSPDGNWFATGSSDTTANLWNLSDPTADFITLQEHTASIYALVFSPDGNWLATSSDDSTANLWNLSTPTTAPITLQGHAASIITLAFSPNGNWLATGSYDSTANLWNLSDPTAAPITLQGHTNAIYDLAFSPDGNWLATGSADGTANLWNLSDPTAAPITLQGHTASINTLAFSPNGNWLATGSADTTATLWNLSDPTAAPITLQGHTDSIYDLTFSPDGNWLATGSADTTATLWNLSDLTVAPITLQKHTNAITTLAFSPNGNQLATGSGDSTVNLWNISDPTAAPITLQGYTYIASIYALAFSPDGNWLAIGSADPTTKLWNLSDPTAAPITLQGHTASINTLAFSPDGTRLATSSLDGTAKIWTLPIDQLIEKACALTGRNMTRKEWQLYFREEPYRPTCPQWATPPEE